MASQCAIIIIQWGVPPPWYITKGLGIYPAIRQRFSSHCVEGWLDCGCLPMDTFQSELVRSANSWGRCDEEHELDIALLGRNRCMTVEPAGPTKHLLQGLKAMWNLHQHQEPHTLEGHAFSTLV